MDVLECEGLFISAKSERKSDCVYVGETEYLCASLCVYVQERV